jgi:hypothetical protein
MYISIDSCVCFVVVKVTLRHVPSKELYFVPVSDYSTSATYLLIITRVDSGTITSRTSTRGKSVPTTRRRAKV